MHQHCCFAPINTYICNKAERQWDNARYCNSKLRLRQKSPAVSTKAGSVPQKFSTTENVFGFFCRHKVELYEFGPWWGLPSNCHSVRLEPSVESVGIFLNDVGWWMVMRVQWRGRPRRNGTFWSAKMVRLFTTFVGVNLCARLYLRANVDEGVRGEW